MVEHIPLIPGQCRDRNVCCSRSNRAQDQLYKGISMMLAVLDGVLYIGGWLSRREGTEILLPTKAVSGQNRWTWRVAAFEGDCNLLASIYIMTPPPPPPLAIVPY